jgi:glycosyltransferase involved in cell wall biosynthesis
VRIVIDLQGAQSDSRYRGIGRYSLSLAQAMVRNSKGHEILIALNGLFPESIEPIRAAFDRLLPQENIKVWTALGSASSADPSNNWRRHTAEYLREAFLISLQPDVLHIASLFEGFGDNAVNSIGMLSDSVITAVTFYDLIPLIQSAVYLTPNPLYEAFYREKLEYLGKADLYLSISESSRLEAIKYLEVQPERVVNISTAGDAHFTVKHISTMEQEAIRRAFGLHRPFLMYSGATDDRKNHLRLIKAFSQLAPKLRKKYQLVLAGKLPQEHRKKFENYSELCGLEGSDLVITGQITDDQMVSLYNLCELFVFPSWHEGFGLPALEAMLCGAPVIASNTTSLPEVIGREDGLFDPFDVDSICEKMTEVLTNEVLKNDLAKHGLEQSKKFSWDETAKRAITALEELHKKRRAKIGGKQSHLRSDDIVSLVIRKVAERTNERPVDDQLLKVAEALDKNHPKNGLKQFLVDISQLVNVDSKTGIQRVVRSILKEVIDNPPRGFKVEPIYANPHEVGYRYARQFMSRFLNLVDEYFEDEPIYFSNSDVFLGLDLQHHVVLQQASLYAEMRNVGVSVHFVVYDLLPVLLPKAFSDGMSSLHTKWLNALAHSDGVICISRAVADEMAEWLTVFGPQRARPLKLGWFHLGADVAGSLPSRGLPPDASSLLSVFSSRPTFLMVGTIEPRKGQMQTLRAFEKLWNIGINANLVMLGRSGWNVELLSEILRIHPERNKHLFWLEGASDEFLEQVYANSTCLIAASEGEGFGLPLIEAAQHRLPIIARDIPVFREVASDHAFYFSGLEPDVLAGAVQEWLARDREGTAPQSMHMPWLTWKQSAQNLLNVLLGQNWYNQWKPDEVKRFWGNDSRLGTQVGVSNGRDICTTNREGYLLFGPYIHLNAGTYQITIKGKLGETGLADARMDVAADKGKHIYGHAPLNHPDERGCFVTMPIKLDAACSDLEVRIWVSAESHLQVSMIEIAPANDDNDLVHEPPPEAHIQAEDSIGMVSQDLEFQRITESALNPVSVMGHFQKEDICEIHNAIEKMTTGLGLVTVEIEEHSLPTPERRSTAHSISDEVRKHANRSQPGETALFVDTIGVSAEHPSMLAVLIERKASNTARNRAKAARKKKR